MKEQLRSFMEEMQEYLPRDDGLGDKAPKENLRSPDWEIYSDEGSEGNVSGRELQTEPSGGDSTKDLIEFKGNGKIGLTFNDT